MSSPSPDARSTAPACLEVLRARGWDHYALIDSGGGHKLERYGAVTVIRPEPQAMWRPAAPEEVWRADAEFTGAHEEEGPGRWRADRALPETWPLPYRGVTLGCRLTAFRHIGVFPEQRAHWDWMIDRAGAMPGPPRVLNLFGYTGAATLLLAAAGAHVTHVDASKKAIAWARENQALSGLEDRPIRWICEDAQKFAAREVRRGRQYEAVILDPPKFGRGPKNEVWNILDDLPALLADVARLLSPEAGFLVLTAYALRASALAMHNLLAESLAGHRGSLASGELALVEEASGRLLPTSLFSRWSRP